MLLRIIKLCAYYILNYRKLCLVKNGLNNDTNKVTKKRLWYPKKLEKIWVNGSLIDFCCEKKLWKVVLLAKNGFG